MKKIINAFLWLLPLISFWSCRPQPPVPKPKSYFKIDLPHQHEYQVFEDPAFPFSFEYPVYGEITQDTLLVLQEDAPYWINVSFKKWSAIIFLSYKPVSIAEPIHKLIDESYRLSLAHDIKADYIKTPLFKTSNDLHGVYYTVGGNAASAFQFYITDSVKNFMRGALYFSVSPNEDSLKPAIDFFRKDMEHLVNSLKFK